MPRTILFVDPPAFCTTVEALVAPALRTRPVAVAPPGAERAVVLALSTEARRAGIERGMAVRQALKLCPDLVFIPPNPRLYARASSALHEILRAYAPVIEPRGTATPFSISPAPAGCSVRRSMSPRGCGGKCASGSASRSRSASPPTSW